MSLKLTYFSDNKGRNELTRLIFAVGGVQYKDDVIGFSQYQTMRNAGLLPWGQLPVLTIVNDNTNREGVFGQSCSIARYAAKVSGLYPSNDLDALRSDEVVDSWRDTLDLYYDCYFHRKILGGRMQMVPRKPAERCVRLKVLLDTELGEQFNRFEKLLANNGGQVCTEKDVIFPSWADLAIYDLVKSIEGPMTKGAFAEMMEDKPMLRKLVKRIEDLDSIKKHLNKYPYNDLTEHFTYVPCWRRIFDAIFFPFLELLLSIQSRFHSLRG